MDGKGKHLKSAIFGKKRRNERNKFYKTRARTWTAWRCAGKIENEGTYDGKFQIHFRPLRSLQDRLRSSRPFLTHYSFPRHSKLYGIMLPGLPIPLVFPYNLRSREYFIKTRRVRVSWTILHLAFRSRDTRYADLREIIESAYECAKLR